MFSLPLSLRWENSLKRNTEIKYQIRLHIGMRLAATYVGDRAWMHRSIRGAGGVLSLAIVGPVVICRISQGRINDLASDAQVISERMRVLRQLLNIQSDG